MLTAEEKKEQAKELFAHVYNEQPSDFKNTFNKILNTRILDRIEDNKTDVIKNINAKNSSSDV